VPGMHDYLQYDEKEHQQLHTSSGRCQRSIIITWEALYRNHGLSNYLVSWLVAQTRGRHSTTIILKSRVWCVGNVKWHLL